jgi:hypothetical protein
MTHEHPSTVLRLHSSGVRHEDAPGHLSVLDLRSAEARRAADAKALRDIGKVALGALAIPVIALVLEFALAAAGGAL